MLCFSRERNETLTFRAEAGGTLKQILTVQVPMPVGGYRSLMIAIRTPSQEEEDPDSLLDIQIYERSAADADLEKLEFVGTAICLCQDRKDPDHKMYLRVYKDCTGFVDEEVFIPTAKGYPVILAGPENECYESTDLEKHTRDNLPDPLIDKQFPTS